MTISQNSTAMPGAGKDVIDADASDVRMVIARLETSALEASLLDADVARILHRAPGTWPMPVAEHWLPMNSQVERRLRQLDEVCRMLPIVFGADAPAWLRRPNGPVGMTPLEFLATEPGGLGAMFRVLRSRSFGHDRGLGDCRQPRSYDEE